MARTKKTGGAKRGKSAARAKVGARAKPAARAGRAKARPGTSRKKARSGGDGVASLEALARRIVRATSLPSFSFRDLYTEDCVSEEATGDVVRGITGLEEKLARWEQMQSSTKWRARNVWCKGTGAASRCARSGCTRSATVASPPNASTTTRSSSRRPRRRRDAKALDARVDAQRARRRACSANTRAARANASNCVS
jgi:hypothetical protein